MMDTCIKHYINPYTDFGFKKLFGIEMNKDLLVRFLNVPFKGQEIIRDIPYLMKKSLIYQLKHITFITSKSENNIKINSINSLNY